jgi:hypothetical protein
MIGGEGRRAIRKTKKRTHTHLEDVFLTIMMEGFTLRTEGKVL